MMTLYDEILSIVEEELPGIGKYMLKKQLKDMGMDGNNIGPEDIPKISRALSEASAMFGREKSRALAKKIEKVSGVENTVNRERNRSKKLRMLMDMAATKQRIGELDESLRLYDEARKIATSMDSPKIVSEIKREMGNIKIRKGDFRGAEEDFLDAHGISERIFDRKGRVLAIIDLGSLEWKRGNYGKSLKYLESALRMAKDMRDDELEGKAYMSMANTYDERGEHEKAIMYSELALKSLERTGNERGIVTIYNNMGVAYARFGDMNGDNKAYVKSKKYYEKCIGLSEKLGYMVMEGWAAFNMAETLAKMGDFDTALEYADRSRKIFERMDDDLGLSGALMSFAIIYREKGDFEKAREYFEKTLKLRRELKTPYRIADALYEYGLFLKKTGDERWKEVLKEAAMIFEEVGNRKRAEEARKSI